MRYCEFCGNKLEDGKVCGCEGARSKYAVDAPAVNQQKPGGLLHVIVRAVIVAAAILLALSLTGRMLINVDLRDVVQANFRGVDSKGVLEYKAGWNEVNSSVLKGETEKQAFESQVHFTPDRSDGLSNGDTVTIRVECPEEVLKACGVRLMQDKLEFKVEGLSAYVRSPSQLTEAFLEEVDRESRDILTARILADPYRNYAWTIYEPDKTSWDVSYIGSPCKSFFGNSATNGFGIDALTQEAVYVVCRKDITEADPENNFLAAIYRMDAHDGYQPGTHTLYYLVRFNSVLADSSGAVSADLLNPHEDTGARAPGMDIMYQKKLTPYLENYTVTRLETTEPES